MGPTTRATTGRIAKAKANERLRRLIGQDNEVSFPNMQQYQTIDEDYDTTEKSPYAIRPNDTRVSMLECQMGDVKKEVQGINSKLDMLIGATLKKSNPVSHSMPPRPPTQREVHETRFDDTIPYNPLPDPVQLRSAANQDGYVNTMVDRARFAPPQHKGKSQMFYDNTEHDMPKPYMYIQREGCQTDKQKLEVRCALTALEYINATLALIRDTRAYDQVDLLAILRHLQDVTQDAMQRDWPAVRRWSQFIWD